MELQGIKGMWSLRSSTDDPFDTFLVVSFISETRILAMNSEDELEETEIEGFYSQAQTLFCQDAIHNQLVQVSFPPCGIKFSDRFGMFKTTLAHYVLFFFFPLLQKLFTIVL